ncbi:MAG: hypothetical protein ACYTGG_03310 [Planctomycetota bacterium]|jgi:hypothetical protein
MRKRQRWIARSGAAALAAAVTLVGCTTPPAPPVDGLSSGLRSLGMLPVEPPSEDVRVGDVFVYAKGLEGRAATGPDDPKGSFLAASGRWESLPMLEELRDEYRERPAFPATPDSFLQIDPDPSKREWQEAMAGEGGSLFTPQEARRRLALVELNAFAGTSMSEYDLNQFIPTEAVNLTMGTSWLDAKAVTLRVSAAESYALSMQRVIDRLVEDAPTSDEDAAPMLRDPYRRHLALLETESEMVWLEVVSEVLYVRSLDISIQAATRSRDDDELVASELTAADESVGGGTGGEAGAGGSDGAVDHALDPAYGAFLRAGAINEVLMGSDSDDVPGGFVRFISVTDESVALRRIWQRGLAVGVRGVALEVNRRTGEIRRLRPYLIGSAPDEAATP